MYLNLSPIGPVTAVGFSRLLALSPALQQESQKADSAEATECFLVGFVMASKFHHREKERSCKEAKVIPGITSFVSISIGITS